MLMSHTRPKVEGCVAHNHLPHCHAHIRFEEDVQITPAEEDTPYHVSKVPRLPPTRELLTLLLNFHMTQVVSREPVMR